MKAVCEKLLGYEFGCGMVAGVLAMCVIVAIVLLIDKFPSNIGPQDVA